MAVQVSQYYYDQIAAQVQNEQNFLVAHEQQRIQHERALADAQAVLADLEPTDFGE